MYETSKVLHRDISVSNIMYRRVGSTVQGVLCDWDLAYDPENPYPPEDITLVADPNSKVNKDQVVIEKCDKEHVRLCYRTGTGPFMALDLLAVGRVPLHLYRHDLESFFFVLIWFCAVFDPETHTFGHLKNWESSDLVSIGLQKRHFLEENPIFDQVLRRVHTEYGSLVDTWCQRLRRLFKTVNVTKRCQMLDYTDLMNDAYKAGNQDEYQYYAEKIRTVQRERDEWVTFDRFMSCLRDD